MVGNLGFFNIFSMNIITDGTEDLEMMSINVIIDQKNSEDI